ncbi:hypothetical protein DBV15_05850 [Temnothorax longispinosus]|uniref:Uncharacterized protein n=1 Tax=Temnothorax longispinosus TaxID=300112 RepID=A0A4S2JNS8_9HYME|nr:hypothetical protein DBV15_05850 [Temnothorax longispinosus]
MLCCRSVRNLRGREALGGIGRRSNTGIEVLTEWKNQKGCTMGGWELGERLGDRFCLRSNPCPRVPPGSLQSRQVVVTADKKSGKGVKTRYGLSSHSSLWKSRNERRCSDLTVRHGRHREPYFPAEMSSTRLRGWFAESKRDVGMRGVGMAGPIRSSLTVEMLLHVTGERHRARCVRRATTGRCKTWRG